jgi:hypothetical protein
VEESKCKASWRRVSAKLPGRENLLVECFQGHYKDGTTGTYDYRAGFASRLLVCGFMMSVWENDEVCNNSPISIVAIFLIAISLFYAHVRPCKKQYMNVLESLLYCSAGLLLITIIHDNNFSPLPHIVL